MALETGTYISDLVTTNPVGGTDPKSQGDDHIRLIKSTLQTTFPNVSGAMTSTHTELNNLDGYTGNTADLNVLAGTAALGVSPTEVGYLNGVTSAIQTQLDTLAISGSISPTDLAISQWGGEYIKLSDVKFTGTSGGSTTALSWQTRTLNTEDSDTGSHCTLATNQFTLAAGTYRIKVLAPAWEVNRHKIRLRNISDSTTDLTGRSDWAPTSPATQTYAGLEGQFTIASSKTFEIQHYTTSSVAGQGFGVETSDGSDEVYTVVELWKVK